MAGIVYKGEFTDDAGNNCSVCIYDTRKVSDSITTIEMGSTPVIIKTIGDSDSKFQHILPTEAYIEVVSSSFLQFIDFFTLYQKTFYVYINRGAELIWAGWINPEYYTEAFVTYPHTITIHAIDGLAELKNIPFPEPEVVALNFKQSVIYYITECLKLTGLYEYSRAVNVAVNIVAQQHDNTIISSRIFENVYIDFRALQDDEGEMFSCFQVLEEILAAFDARLYQDKYSWHITRVDQKYTNYTVESYIIYSGVYSASSTANVVTSLTANLGVGSTLRFLHPANLEIQPAAKKFTLKQSYNSRANLFPSVSYKMFKGGDFDETTGKLKFATEYNGGLDHCRDEVIDDCLRIKGIYLSLLNAIEIKTEIQNEGSDDINALIAAWAAGRITLVFSFDVSKRFTQKESSDTFAANIQLFGNFSGSIYRYKDDAEQNINILGQKTKTKVGLTLKTSKSANGSFKPLADLGTITVDMAGSDDFVTVVNKIAAPPDNELTGAQTYLQFYLHLFPCATDLTEEQVSPSDGLMFKNMNIFFTENFTETYEREIETTINASNVLVPDDYEVKFGNTPDNANCNSWGVLHKSVLFDENGDVLRNWGYNPTTKYIWDITEGILVNDLYTTYNRPKFILNGTLLNTTLGTGTGKGYLLDKVLKDYDNRYYVPMSVNYNMRTLEIESKWICIRDEGTTGEFNDDFSEDFFI
jgi:hypothetical protein